MKIVQADRTYWKYHHMQLVSVWLRDMSKAEEPTGIFHQQSWVVDEVDFWWGLYTANVHGRLIFNWIIYPHIKPVCSKPFGVSNKASFINKTSSAQHIYKWVHTFYYGSGQKIKSSDVIVCITIAVILVRVL